MHIKKSPLLLLFLFFSPPPLLPLLPLYKAANDTDTNNKSPKLFLPSFLPYLPFFPPLFLSLLLPLNSFSEHSHTHSFFSGAGSLLLFN